MRIRFEPELVEEAVSLELIRREHRGDFVFSESYREMADQIYKDHPAESRTHEFEVLHERFFHRLGLSEGIHHVLRRFPEVKEKLRELTFAKAQGKQRPGLEVRNGDPAFARVTLKSELFGEPHALLRFLAREFLRLSDLLNPHFSGGALAAGAGTTRFPELIRQRFRTLWDISLYGRLSRRGEMFVSREECGRELKAVFPRLSDSALELMLYKLWDSEDVTQAELQEMARAHSHSNPRTPGAQCPLCHFPTHDWVTEEREAIVGLIRQDYPDWESSQGICSRCLELYQMQAGCW
ncbi:MAG: hypothetical protein HY652_11785 [Acidobacteria bacterium]|nr:hypothetical protein [Acidobacteriota bacterium]